VGPEHTIGAEVGNRYAARSRRASASRRSASATQLEPSRKPRDAADLLAKIDAIYQELTLQPLPKRARRAELAPAAVQKRPMGLIFIGILIIALTVGEVWLYFDRHSAVKRAPPPELVDATTEAKVKPAVIVPSVLPPPAIIEPTPAASTPRESFDGPEKKARAAAQRKADRRQKAEQEASRRALEAEEQARRTRIEEAKRAEAEQLAAAKAAAPRGPASPEELCADRANFFSRNSCEARACQQPEWQNHASCVRRKEELQRTIPGGG
jgi:type IV secretory pathway VirB10-like protein